MWRLAVFFEGVLGLGVVVMSMVSGLMLLRHDGGPSAELAQSVGLLALFFSLLLVTGRWMTGRWFRWSRR